MVTVVVMGRGPGGQGQAGHDIPAAAAAHLREGR